jgi:hypothetical protein
LNVTAAASVSAGTIPAKSSSSSIELYLQRTRTCVFGHAAQFGKSDSFGLCGKESESIRNRIRLRRAPNFDKNESLLNN